MVDPQFAEALEAALRTQWPDIDRLSDIIRLSGGASQEIWAFDARRGDVTMPLILRRTPGGKRAVDAGTSAGTSADTSAGTSVALATEAQMIRAAAAVGVPVPEIHVVFSPDDAVGEAYVMQRLEGETLARKILRDDSFATIRPHLARECGRILGLIHQIPRDAVPALRVADGPAQLEQYRAIYDRYDHPHSVFELAFAWLSSQLKSCRDPVVVHGDFRNGNLVIAPDGVRGVLDWELVHLGDPREDLGWICVNSWRFGISTKRVGGFGDVADMLDGYAETSGVRYTPKDVLAWEALGSLKWGIMCMSMYHVFASFIDRSVERAAIGRRASEAEMDLVNLMKEAMATP